MTAMDLDRGRVGEVIVITGPIASGKTSVALELARSLRRSGSLAAAIDMDDVVEMLAGKDWKLVTRDHWRLAGSAAAALIDRLVEDSPAVVVFAGTGPFFESHERRELEAQLRTKPRVRFVTLLVSLAESLRRVAVDSDRVLTKDPEFVSKLYRRVNWTSLPTDQLVLTDGHNVEHVVREILSELRLSPLVDPP